MTEVVVAILNDEDVDLWEVDVVLVEVDKVHLRKAPDNIVIVDIAITSPKSVGKNLAT